MPALPAHSPAPLRDLEGFRRALLTWFAVHQRRLPWRDSPSLYKTVVSEFMLQQTQVKTVLPYFARWLQELPDFAALAAAPEERVLRLWEGLGYYSRARNLHRLAKALAALPSVPTTADSWMELPGVGPYTAAAITSIAFGTPAACVDGNVVRILARLTADGTEFRDSASASKTFAPLAGSLLDRGHPGDHNQAMMELGATVCHRHSPLCTVCPVLSWCAAAQSGEPERFPRLAAKQIEQRSITRIWWISHRGLLLHRSGADAKRFANMHELPTIEQVGEIGGEITPDRLLARKKRGITRYSITESIYAAPVQWSPESRQLDEDLVWVPLADLETVSVSGPHRRWIRELLGPKL